MGIEVSVFLMAVGAILAWGIDVDSAEGFNINTIGVILIVVGAIDSPSPWLAIFGRGRGRQWCASARFCRVESPTGVAWAPSNRVGSRC